MKLWFYRWLISWATLCQGIVGILTLGIIHPQWELTAAKFYSRARYHRRLFDAESSALFDAQSDAHFHKRLYKELKEFTDEWKHRAEEAETEVERLRAALGAVLEEAESDLNRDIIITECQSALALREA